MMERAQQKSEKRLVSMLKIEAMEYYGVLDGMGKQ